MKLQLLIFIYAFSLITVNSANAMDIESTEDNFSLENLLSLNVIAATKIEQNIGNSSTIVTNISANEILNFGANNLFEVFERTPSLYFVGNYIHQDNVLSIRGDKPTPYNNHVLILINGRPTRDSHFSGLDVALLSSFPLDTIERIEVIRGPGSVLYGTNAYSGVINIISKKSNINKASFSAGYGSFGAVSARGTTLHAKGDTTITTGFQLLLDDGWDFAAIGEAGSNIDGSPADRDISKPYWQRNFGANFSLEHDQLSLDLLYVNSEKATLGVIPIRVYPGPPSAPPINKLQPFENRTINVNRLFMNLGYDDRHNDNFHQTYNMTYNNQYAEFLTPSGLVSAKTEDILLEYTGFYIVNDISNYIYGGTAYWIDGQQSIGDDDINIRGVPKYSETSYSLYAEVHIKPLDQLNITFGLQANRPKDLDTDIINRIGLVYHFNKASGIKLQASGAFRAPVPFEKGLADPPVLKGNPDLEPETATTYEIQYFYYTENLQWTLTYFNTRQEDLITRTGSGSTTYTNANELELDGFELDWKWLPFHSPKLYITGSVTKQDNILNDKAGIFGSDERIDNFTHVPNDMVKLGAIYHFNTAITLGVFNTYMSAPSDVDVVNPLREEVNPKADAFNFLTAKLSIDITKILEMDNSMKLEFYGTNILNNDIHIPESARRQINTLPGRAGRALYSSFRMEF